MKKVFALIICLAILVPSISFGISQEQYLLLIAKSLYNQVEKLKQEQYYANIFKFLNKKKAAQKEKFENLPEEKQEAIKKRMGAATYDCVEREIADKIIEEVSKKFPEKAKGIDRDNQKTILWRCMVNKEGEGEYNSLLHCRENCGFRRIPGIVVKHNETEVLDVSLEDENLVQDENVELNNEEVIGVAPIMEEETLEPEIIEETMEEEIIEEELENSKPIKQEVRWSIGEDGFCRKNPNGEFANYGECVKEAKQKPAVKEAQFKKAKAKKAGVVGWFLGALGLK